MKIAYKIKVLFAVILIALICFEGHAQKFSAQVSSKVVQVGQMFELAFVINGNASEFTPPNFKDFDIAGGPNQSSSVQIINGNMSQSITLSYLLVPKKEGKLVIGAASVNSDGKRYESQPISIEAVKGNASGSQNNQASGDPKYNQKGSGGDVFIRTGFSKQKCFLGEQIIISQKVYSRHQIVGFQKFNPPTYDGFWSQTLESTSGNQTAVENLDGVNYYTYELFRNIATPNKTGKISLNPIDGEVIIRKQTNAKPRNIFEQFFGTGGYEDIAVKVSSRASSVEVMDLPSEGRPANFGGAVGDFTYKVETTRQTVKANDAFNLKLTIAGKGNIKLIDAPKLTLPESFESYEPKLIETGNSKTFDYLVIPRQEGEFELKDLDFSYFNLDSKRYITIPSPQIIIKVLPPDPNSTGAQVYNPTNEVKEVDNDIRYIKKGNFNLSRTESEFFNSFAHLFNLILPFLLLTAAIIIRKNYIKNNSNVVAVKERKAARIAKKQLVSAEKFMSANKKDEFYTEILNALNNYLSNKLNLPLADVSRANIQKILSEKGITDDLISKLIQSIDTSEYAKYAPGAVSGDLKMVYENTVTLITTLEEHLNTKKA